MAKKDRDYDTILKGCKEFADAVKAIRECAKTLDSGADIAQNTLKDSVSKKNIDAVKELSAIILKQTQQGEERVRELEQKVRSEKSRYEELER